MANKTVLIVDDNAQNVELSGLTCWKQAVYSLRSPRINLWNQQNECSAGVQSVRALSGLVPCHPSSNHTQDHPLTRCSPLHPSISPLVFPASLQSPALFQGGESAHANLEGVP